MVTVGQLYPGYSDASHWEWVSCGRVHSVQVFRSGVAQDPALLRESDGPGRLGLLLQNVEVEVIVIKVDIEFSKGGDRFA